MAAAAAAAAGTAGAAGMAGGGGSIRMTAGCAVMHALRHCLTLQMACALAAARFMSKGPCIQ